MPKDNTGCLLSKEPGSAGLPSIFRAGLVSSDFGWPREKGTQRAGLGTMGFRLNFLRFSGRLGVSVLLLVASGTAGADVPKRKVDRFEVESSGYRAGAARAVVDAPRHVVRQVVTDYDNYDHFITRFKAAKIVGRSGDKTDVYLQVPIMKGAVKIWAIVRFNAPRTTEHGEVISGRMVKGNVKRLDASWRIKRLDEKRTELTLELLILPKIPIPDGLRLSELRFAAFKAVSGTRDEAERRTPGS